ncbi:hypothetical protein Landi51_12849 [Colletotrichum acutatum]
MVVVDEAPEPGRGVVFQTSNVQAQVPQIATIPSGPEVRARVILLGKVPLREFTTSHTPVGRLTASDPARFAIADAPRSPRQMSRMTNSPYAGSSEVDEADRGVVWVDYIKKSGPPQRIE